MFQFTNETIINSAKTENGLDRFIADKTTLRVLKAGNFPKECTSEIKKTAKAEPSFEKLVVTPKALVIDDENPENPKKQSEIFRLSIVLRNIDVNTSDYADNMTTAKKQLWYEGKGTTIEDVLADIEKAYKNEQSNSKNAYVNITVAGGELTITCVEPTQKLVEVELQQVFTPLNASTGYTSLTGLDTYKVVENLLAGGPTVAGNPGFGTTRQLMKNHRLPTIESTNWLALHQDERPIPGGYYNQYQMTLTSVRPNMGMAAVGQTVTSVTNHIFYILDGEVSAAFEKAAKDAGLTIA